MKFFALICVTLALCSTTASADISVFPPSPHAFETVRVHVAQGTPTQEVLDFRKTRVTIGNGRISVALVASTISPAPPEPGPALDIPLGQFPGGNTFDVEVHVESSTGAFVRSLGLTSFSIPVRGADEPLWNLTDLWWNPDESGWGFNIAQHGSGVIFATWFVYGADGKPIWYVIPDGRWFGSGVGYRGSVYRTTGPEFCHVGQVCPGPTFDPARVTRTLVGEGTISIDGTNFDRAVLTLTVDGNTVTRIVQRQPF